MEVRGRGRPTKGRFFPTEKVVPRGMLGPRRKMVIMKREGGREERATGENNFHGEAFVSFQQFLLSETHEMTKKGSVAIFHCLSSVRILRTVEKKM